MGFKRPRVRISALGPNKVDSFDTKVFETINLFLFAKILAAQGFSAKRYFGIVSLCALWRCNSKFNGKARCGTPTLSTESIQQMFLQAYNQLMGNREQVIQACAVMRGVVADCSKLDSEIATMNEEIQVIAGLVSQCIKENATTQQSQEEYTEKYNRLVKRYEKAVSQLKKATADRESRMQRDRELRIFISSIKEKPLVLETWDKGLWITLLETATVHADNRITFRFKDGTGIEVGAE